MNYCARPSRSMVSLFRIAALTGLGLSALGAAGAAYAQVTNTPLLPPAQPATLPDAGQPVESTSGPGHSAAAPQPDEGGIADIIVTAQRRSENLQNVPISVTAVTLDQLQARGVNSTRDVIAAVPALTAVTVAGYFQPRLRGIGNSAVGAGFEGGVAVYVDGVYQAAAQGNLFSLSGIDRIEVLKGPQGTLFGRNTTGGLIQVITREPSSDYGGTASFTAANYQDFTGDLYVTGGLAEGLSMNLTAHAEAQGEGWGKNLATGQDVYRTYHDISVRSSLLFEPSVNTKIRITADYTDNHNNIASATVLAPGTGFPFPGLMLPTRRRDVNTDVQPSIQIKSGGVSGQATQDLGFASVVSITAYRRSSFDLIFDGDVSNLNLIDISVTQPDHQFSQELQLVSNRASRVKWVIGAFYFDAAARFDPSQALIGGFLRPVTPLGPVTGAQTLDRLGTRSLAGYAQATAPIFDATNLTLGFRYTSERKNITDVRSYTLFAALPAPVPGAAIPNQSVSYNRPTWRVSLDHRFSPEVLAYASYNRGFKSGGYNGQYPTDAPYLPEEIDAYEVGVKTDLLDRHLRINAAAFYYDYTNIQVSRFVGSLQSFYNGAAAHIYGIDLDFEARLTSNLTLSGGLTALHDRFTSFPNATISTQVPTGIVITTGSATGNRLPLSADFSGTLTGTYRTSVGFGELALDASYSYNCGYFTQPDNILHQPAYHLLSAGTALNFPNGMSARLWMRNILDTVKYNTLQAGTFDSNASYDAPRTYGITLGAKF